MSKPKPSFAVDEIEALLAQLPRPEDNQVGVTTREVADAIPCSKRIARERYIRPLVRAGFLRPALVWRQLELLLHQQRVKGYVFTTEEGES